MTLDKNAMFEIIKKVEGEYSAPYYDSVGKVTLGVGFNIEDVQKLRNLVFVTLGIGEISSGELRRKTIYKADGTVDSVATTKLATYFESLKNLIENDTYNGSSSQSALDAQSKVLNTNLNTIMSQIQSDPLLSDYKSSFHSTSSLTHNEVKNIFDSIIDTYSNNVDTFLNSISGGDKLAISSEMYQALVSLSYNGLSMTQSSMPGLADAIKNGNRAEAWFQIRYDTNKKYEAGVYKRRFFESEIFGIFAGSTPTEEEAKDFFKMMRYHESKIKTINETDVVANANRDYGAGSAHALNTFQKDALLKLTELYGQGVEIQNAIVGTDTVNDNSSNRGNENINDTLQGTDKNDLIFGERGDDTITGGAGSDVIYGGMGTDILSGGSGNDAYAYNKGDGKDTIDDQGNDSADKLLFGAGITQKDLIVTVSGNDLIVRIKGSEESDVITLKNWYKKENRIEYFEFADGTRLDENGIIALMATDDVDTVKGTENENTLTGGANADTLVDNGEGKDTYLAGAGDTIIDGDGKGRVSFEGVDLHEGIYDKNTGTYIGDGGIYSLSSDGILKFTNSAGTLTIMNYSKSANSLGIHLEDKDDEDEENPNTDDILPETSAGEGHNENFSSPLVLDLNGNGTTSTFIAQTNTYFDMDGDGFKERTSWTESSDGLLTLDLNNDGKVTNGGELFGNNTKLANGTNAKDGFEALSQYDLNKDNVIDTKDSIYSHLKVWIDSNSDGISTNDELKTLQELNITSINLNATETSTSEAYNQISDSSSFTQDGETKTINDVWFYQDKSDTTYDYTTPIKESVAALPTIEGSGRVKDLRDAMNDDTVLEAKVTNLLKSAFSMSFSNFEDVFNLFTCKPFSIPKVLHVKIQIQHKRAQSGEEARVA